MKNVVVITGSSGSGLSSAEYVFEELGYFVIKNIPPSIIGENLKELLSEKLKIDNLCITVHAIGAKETFENLVNRHDANYRFVVLNCEKEELLKRYALSRRVHPRSVIEKITPSQAIEEDISDILSVSKYANLYLDTTSLTVKELRARLYKFLNNVEEDKITSVNFISFGIKNGVPQGIDTFFDVRLIPNPYWVEELKELNGEDEAVIKYMNSFPITKEVVNNIITYLEKYLKDVSHSGRANYTIGIACSGGQHRSTYVANLLAKHFSKEYRTQVFHRDSPELNKNGE